MPTSKHKSNLILAAVTAVGASILSGCAADPILPDKAELYNREFIKEFGAFDPNHDWNHATKVSVNVSTTRPTEVKIYAVVDNVRYLFGTFLNVEGQRTLSVDIPKGTDRLIVRANGIDYDATPGSNIDLSSRGSRAGEGTPVISAALGARTNWKTFSHDEILSYRERLPEGYTNLEQVTDNFTFTPTHNFIIYPTYHNTSNSPEIGIYYRPNNTTNPADFVLTPIFYSKESYVAGGISEGSTSISSSSRILQKCTDYEWVPDPDLDPSANGFVWDTYRLNYETEHNTTDTEYLLWDYCPKGEWEKSGLSQDEIDAIITKYKNTYSDITSDNYALIRRFSWVKAQNTTNSNESYDENAKYWRSKGVEITITPGVTYGFYMKVDGGEHIFYSETAFNENLGALDHLKKREDKTDEEFEELKEKYYDHPIPHFGIYDASTEDTKLFVVGGEDWYAWGDYDLNDVVFFVENIDPEETWPPFSVVDKDVIDVPYQWVIACEDLGSTDFDFNDVVFGISDVVKDEQTSTATVDVTALASGGTLPVYLYYGNSDTPIIPDNTNKGEFHSWFGNYSTSTVINAHSFNGPGVTATVTVDPDFTLECCTSVKEEGESGNMGGFKVEIHHKDGKVVLNAANPNIENNNIGAAPQMICVPYTWLWPRENVSIDSVYEDFLEWCKNRNYNHDWHKNPVGSYVTRPLPEPGTGEEGGGNEGGGNESGGTILTGERMDDPWTGAQRWKYTIDANTLANATSIQVTVESNAGYTTITDANGSVYQTATYGTAFSGDDLTKLKDEGYFCVNYGNITEALTAKVTIAIK